MPTIHSTRSELISSVSYDEENKILELKFSKGSSYRYNDVPKSIFNGIISANSAGNYFHNHIKGKFKTEKLD